MFANREGRFRARVIEQGVAPTGSNNLVTATLRFMLTEEKDGDEWKNVESEGMEITAYCYLTKKDGSINDFQIKAMKEAFEWDGRDFFWLQDNELPLCQVTLGYETYNDEQKLRVKFVNHYDSEGGGGEVKVASQTERQQIVAKYGAKLRALSGGTPTAAPAQTTKPPQAPQETPETPLDAPESNQADAWRLFMETAQVKGCKQDVTEREWWRAIKLCAGGISDTALVTPAQWYRIQTEGLAGFDDSGFDGLPF